MILLVSIGVAIILLAILIFAIPLRLSLKGRGIILAASVIVGIIGIVAIQVLSLWQVILYPFLLSIVFSYLILKKIELNPEPEETHSVEDIVPAFSFAEQVEKAKLAETIDEYYDTVKIPNNGLSNDEILNSEIPNTDIVETPGTISLETMSSDVEIPSSEMISLEMPDVETPSIETQNVGLEEIIPLDVEANQRNDDSINEIVEPIIPQIDIPSEMIDPEIDLIDFEERDLHTMEEYSDKYVEQSIASSLETEEEQLMESRRRLFQSMDQDSAELTEKTDVPAETESIDNRKMIEKPEELNDNVRIKKLEDISAFTTSLDKIEEINGVARTEGIEEISHSAIIDDVEEINDNTTIKNSREINDVGNIDNPDEISELAITEEELTESKRKRAAEHREKQQMYQDKVLAQFEDLEEIYLSKKGKIRNKEEL